MERMFRLLRADEIECRVQTIKKNGLSLLLYKDARCDMSILDETVGAENWQRDHKELKNVIYAGVGINKMRNTIEPPQYIWKWDAGSESYTEKEKGEASDSFKRACVNWGIGRELYTAPFIWIKAADTKIEEQREDKFICKDSFTLSDIEYDEAGNISYLLIRNRGGEIVYQFNEPMDSITPRKKLLTYCKEHALDLNDVATKYDLTKDSTDADYVYALDDLKAGD